MKNRRPDGQVSHARSDLDSVTDRVQDPEGVMQTVASRLAASASRFWSVLFRPTAPKRGRRQDNTRRAWSTPDAALDSGAGKPSVGRQVGRSGMVRGLAGVSLDGEHPAHSVSW